MKKLTEQCRRIMALLLITAIILSGMPLNLLYQFVDAATVNTERIDFRGTGTCTPDAAYSKCEFKLIDVTDQKTLDLKYNIELGEYLNGVLDEKTGERTIKDFIFDYNGDITSYAAYLNGLDDSILPPVSFECEFDATQVKLPNATSTTGNIIADVDGSNQSIGSYEWIIGDGKITFKVTYDKSIYYYSDVSASASVSIELITALSQNQVPQFTYNTTSCILEVTPYDLPVDISDPASNYIITKSAISDDDTPYTNTGTTENTFIDYEITLSADRSGQYKGNLSGKVIQDILPAGLEIEGATIASINGSDIDEGISLDMDDSGQWSYEFPDNPSIISTAIIKMRARLTEVEAKKAVQAAGGYDKNFKNHADLYRSSDLTAEPFQSSNEVTTNIKFKFFDKFGNVVSGNSRQYQWFVDINSYATRLTSSYVIDTLDTDFHNYYKTFGVKVYDKNKKTTVTMPIVNLTFPTNPAPTYGELTNGELRNDSSVYFNYIKSELGTDSVGYYEYDLNGKTMAALIIPFDNHWGKNVELSYITSVLGDATTDQVDELENSAKLLWKAYWYGHGPGHDDFDIGFSLNKRVTVDYSLVSKSGRTEDYNRKTQTMTWHFQVNKYRSEINSLDIEDTLDSTIQEFIVGSDITFTTGTGTYTQLKYESNPASVNDSIPYYTLISGSGNNKTLKIHFPYLNHDDYYEFDVKTKVKDTTLLTKNVASKSISNEAVVTAKIGTQDYVQNPPPSDILLVSHTVISKKADSAPYNFVDNSIGWAVTVNQECTPIVGAVVSDSLPTGASIGKLKKIIKYDNTGNIVGEYTASDGNSLITASESGGKITQTLNGSTTGFGMDLTFDITTNKKETNDYLANTMDIKFGDTTTTLDCTYEFQFETNFTDEKYKLDYFQITPITVRNTVAYIEGTVYGKDIRQSVYAAKSIASPPIEKSGQYYVDKDPEDQTKNLAAGIKWQIIVNREGTDLEGWKVIDKLKDIFEMDMNSFTVSPIQSISSSGAVLSTGVPITTDFNTPSAVFVTGFAITIPNAHKNKPLLIEFKSFLVDDATVSQMKNSVMLSSNSGISMETEEIQASDAVNFNLEQFCKGSSRPYLSVKKYSSNKDVNGKYFQEIVGAEFELTKVDINGNPIGNEKEKPTSNRGTVTFMFLEYNQLYKVTETQAPPGYILPDDQNVRYVYFYKGTVDNYHPITNFPNGMTAEAVSINSTVRGKIYELANEPNTESGSTGELKFNKITAEGTSLAGVEFKISRTHNGTTYQQTTTSSANGEVAFMGLDPGDYILTEVSNTTSAPFFIPSTWVVNVTVSAAKYSFTMEENNGITSSSGVYTLKNDYKAAPVTLKKYHENNPAKSATGAVFTVYVVTGSATGIPVAYLVDGGSGTYKLNSNAPNMTTIISPTNELGTPYFKNSKLIYGDYYFEETYTPSKYYPDETTSGSGILKKHPFKIAKNSTALDFYYLNNSTSDAISENNETKFFNQTVPKGVVAFTKKSEDGKVVLPDIEFVLTNKTTNVTKSAISDSNGYVEFTDLDIGNYTLEEKSGLANESFKVPTAKWDVKITTNAAADKDYNYTITNGEIGTVTGSDPNYVIKNIYIGSSVELKKRDVLNSVKIVTGGQFTVYAHDTNDAVAYLIESPANSGNYLLSNKDKTGTTLVSTTHHALGTDFLQVSGAAFKLLPGVYDFEESITPAGYLPDYEYNTTNLKRYSFRVNTSGDTVYLTGGSNVTLHQNIDTIPLAGTNSAVAAFYNTPASKGNIEFYKTTKDGKPLSNITFTLSSGGSVIQTTTSASNGYVAFADVNLGSYTITEVSNANNISYVMPTSSWNVIVKTNIKGLYDFTIFGGDSGTLISSSVYTIMNEYKTGSVILNKRNFANTDRVVTGAGFTVYTRGGNVPIAYLIDSAGTGTYTLTNTSITGNLITPAAVNGRGSAYFTNGKLIYGSYDLIETTTPVGFLPDDGDEDEEQGTLIRHQFDIITNGSVVYITNEQLNAGTSSAIAEFYNYPIAEGRVEFDKISTEGCSLAGVKFTLTKTSGSSFVKTAISDENGHVEFHNLPKGTYLLTENTDTPINAAFKPLTAWDVELRATSDGAFDFIISSGASGSLSSTTPYSITNEYKKSSVVLKKVDANTNQTLADAEFTIYAHGSNQKVAYLVENPASSGTYVLSSVSKSGEPIKTTSSNAAGVLYLQNNQLIYGEYDFVESVAPTGYYPDYAANTQTLKRHTFKVNTDGETIYLNNNTTDAHSTSNNTVFKNTPDFSGMVKFYKQTADGMNLEGITFKLSYGTSVTKTATSDSKGYVQFVGLTPGIYNLTEVATTTSSSFKMPNTSWRVIVALNDSGEYEFNIAQGDTGLLQKKKW